MIPPVAFPTQRRPRRAGFTLIELLTVIAIIGILAAIIIPVVGKVRTTAKRTQGLSNLRQVVLAGLTYAQDNRGQWFPNDRPQPAGVFYTELLAQYSLNIPGTNRNELFHDPLLPYHEGNLHFAVIGIYFRDNWGSLVHYTNFNNIKAPAKTVFFADNWSDKDNPADWEMPAIENLGPYSIYNYPAGVSTSDGRRVPPPSGYGNARGHIDLQRDPGQAKLGFFDGHVAILKREAMQFRLFDPRYQ